MLSRSTLATAAIVLGCCAFVALLAWSEYSNWRNEVERVGITLRQTAESIAQHSDDLAELSRLPLASLISEIREEHGAEELPRKIKALIREQMKASPTLDTLSYIDVDGRMVATSHDQPLQNSDFSDRDYFQQHRRSPFPLPVLGKPIKSRLSGDWVLPIMRKVLMNDGSFGGVVVSTIRVGHFVDFFRRFDAGSEASFLIARGDGVILARGPLEEKLLGTNISAHELFSSYLKASPTGTYSYRSPVDGTSRTGAYYQSSSSGIVVLAAASTNQVLARWMAAASVRWIYTAVLVVLALLAVGVWRHMAKLRERSEELLATREAEFRLLAESSSDVISRFDENGVREYVSPSAEDILGIPADRLVGKSVYASLSQEAKDTVLETITRLRAGSVHEKFVLKHVKPTGEEIWLETAISKLPAQKNQKSRAVAISRDVTRQKAIEDELNALASADELTKLANRRTFNTRFEEMIQQARRRRTPLSLLMIDADHFKAFNDIYGHAAGDGCLRSIAEAVGRCVTRPGDLACRYGGEEFAVLLENTDEAGATKVAENIRRSIRQLNIAHNGNSPSFVTVSIGTATSDASGPESTQALFAQADAALYLAKDRGRNRVVTNGAPQGNVVSIR